MTERKRTFAFRFTMSHRILRQNMRESRGGKEGTDPLWKITKNLYNTAPDFLENHKATTLQLQWFTNPRPMVGIYGKRSMLGLAKHHLNDVRWRADGDPLLVICIRCPPKKNPKQTNKTKDLQFFGRKRFVVIIDCRFTIPRKPSDASD